MAEQDAPAAAIQALPFHEVPLTQLAVPVFVSRVVPLWTAVKVFVAPEPY